MADEIETVEENPEEAPAEADKVEPEPEVSEDDEMAAAFAEVVSAQADKSEELAPEDEVLGEQADETPPEGEATPDAVLDALREAGIEHTYADGEAALTSLIEAKRKVGMDDEDRRLGRWLREKEVAPDELDGLLDAYGKAKEEDRQRTTMPQYGWAPPMEWSPALTEEQQEQFNSYARERWERYYRDPMALVQEIVYPLIAPEMQRMIKSAQSSIQTEARLEKGTAGFTANEIAQVKQLVKQGTPDTIALEHVLLRKQAQTAGTKKLSGEEAKQADLAKAAKAASVKGSRRPKQPAKQGKRKAQEGEDPDSMEWDIRDSMRELGM